ncbi:hypothetical protein [Woodsholea maritima]|uniref:hypothetical protein n=1 Tax=Woodsholea maritima TaxID=240237 RepID=UPI00036E1031|nr:hypothetical protein [Woodsholea maritima]
MKVYVSLGIGLFAMGLWLPLPWPFSLAVHFTFYLMIISGIWLAYMALYWRKAPLKLGLSLGAALLITSKFWLIPDFTSLQPSIRPDLSLAFLNSQKSESAVIAFLALRETRESDVIAFAEFPESLSSATIASLNE